MLIIIKNNKNGLLVDFFDVEGLSKTVIDVLNDPDKYKALKKGLKICFCKFHAKFG